MKFISIMSCLLSVTSVANAADVLDNPLYYPQVPIQQPKPIIVSGYANAIDGRTLYFPSTDTLVRLAGIDACDLPQWGLNPDWHNRKVNKAPQPVPCGAFAKAWLKRTIGKQKVSCSFAGMNLRREQTAFCSVGKQDIGLEMLRVGWAKVDSSVSAPSNYVAIQEAAMSKRYGMWETYILDMDEWRSKAIDKSLDRQPFADFNILAERKSEISPPFQDARNKPKRTDR